MRDGDMIQSEWKAACGSCNKEAVDGFWHIALLKYVLDPEEKQLRMVTFGVPTATHLTAQTYKEPHYLLPTGSPWLSGKVMAARPALAMPPRNNTGCTGTGKLFIFDSAAARPATGEKERQRSQNHTQTIWREPLEPPGLEIVLR